MAEARVYLLGDSLTLAEVAYGLEDYFRRYRNMEAEGVAQAENVYFIQARQRETWKKYAGMDKAVQVRLTVNQNYLTVDVGAGRWVDKLGAAAVGYLLFAPLLITAAIGALDQEQLPREIFDFVERYVLGHGGTIPYQPEQPAPVWEQPPAEPAGTVCQNCQAPLPAGARFCAQCGQPVPAPKVCPQCHAQAAEGARFCTCCGAALN